MCNLITQRVNQRLFSKTFAIAGEISLPKSPNIWPLYPGLIVRARPDGGPGREAAIAQWGLVPHWAPDMKFGRMTNNARAETLASKPTFRNAYKKRRCLIPASGFCEPKNKTCYEFSLPDQPLFAMAGLWETWGPKDSPQESFTMITTEANSLVAEYHPKQRMPVILEPSDYDLWLAGDIDKAGKLLHPYPADRMIVEPRGPWGAKN